MLLPLKVRCQFKRAGFQFDFFTHDLCSLQPLDGLLEMQEVLLHGSKFSFRNGTFQDYRQCVRFKLYRCRTDPYPLEIRMTERCESGQRDGRIRRSL